MKRCPDPREQLRLGNEVAEEILIKFAQDFGRSWVSDNVEDIVDAARALLLDLEFLEYFADTIEMYVVILRIDDAICSPLL